MGWPGAVCLGQASLAYVFGPMCPHVCGVFGAVSDGRVQPLSAVKPVRPVGVFRWPVRPLLPATRLTAHIGLMPRDLGETPSIRGLGRSSSALGASAAVCQVEGCQGAQDSASDDERERGSVRRSGRVAQAQDQDQHHARENRAAGDGVDRRGDRHVGGLACGIRCGLRFVWCLIAHCRLPAAGATALRVLLDTSTADELTPGGSLIRSSGALRCVRPVPGRTCHKAVVSCSWALRPGPLWRSVP